MAFKKIVNERMLRNILYSFLKRNYIVDEFVAEYCFHHKWNASKCATDYKCIVEEVMIKNAHDLYYGQSIDQMFGGSSRRTFPWSGSKKGVAFWLQISDKWVRYTNGLIKAREIE